MHRLTVRRHDGWGLGWGLVIEPSLTGVITLFPSSVDANIRSPLEYAPALLPEQQALLNGLAFLLCESGLFYSETITTCHPGFHSCFRFVS